MISPQYKDLIDGMGKTSQGSALRELLSDEISKLNDVRTIDSFDEVLGRKRAIEIIDKVFGFLKEKKVDTQPRNNYN